MRSLQGAAAQYTERAEEQQTALQQLCAQVHAMFTELGCERFSGALQSILNDAQAAAAAAAGAGGAVGSGADGGGGAGGAGGAGNAGSAGHSSRGPRGSGRSATSSTPAASSREQRHLTQSKSSVRCTWS